MTKNEAIKALADDLGITRARAEDFLNAHDDLLLDALKNGEEVPLGKIGYLRPCVRGGRRALNFSASKEARRRVGIETRQWQVDRGPLCVDCKERPHAPRRTDCHTCKRRKERARAKAARAVRSE